jgi:hypothetical protein
LTLHGAPPIVPNENQNPDSIYDHVHEEEGRPAQ